MSRLGRRSLLMGTRSRFPARKASMKMIKAAGLTPAPLSIDIRALLESPEIQEALAGFSAKIRAWRRFRPLMRSLLDETWKVAREAES